MSIHILLVEDSAVAREKISGILVELGCEVTTAVDGVEGLKLAKQLAGSLDLIVLDIQMPKADGITLLRYLRKIPELTSTLIVMLTTQADKDTVSKALGFGANDFLRKDATIAHITERLSVHLESLRSAAQRANEESNSSPPEIVRDLLQGSRQPGQGLGPYVLCHVPPMEIKDMEEARGHRQREFYERLVAGVERIDQRYPHLLVGYRIDTQSQEVTRLLQADEYIPWVLLLGRRPEGISLARMSGFSKVGENRTIHVLCDPIASLPAEDKKSVTRMGINLIEQSDFDGEGVINLLEQYLLPPAEVLPNDVKLRELVGPNPTRINPKDPQVWTVRYSCVKQDGTILTDAYYADPTTLEKGDESMPSALWDALARLGPDSSALIDVPGGEEGDTFYFHIDVIDVA